MMQEKDRNNKQPKRLRASLGTAPPSLIMAGQKGAISMNVYDFCGLCTEPRMTNVEIYDLNPNCQEPGSIVFKGTMYDASLSRFRDYEVCSFDLTDEGMTVNIDTSAR
jgi:hypothetical protein